MAAGRTLLQKLTYDIVLWFANIIVDIFFREVRPRGSHRVPKDGPILFVAAPHANQDRAVLGKGRLQLLNRKSEPTRIHGIDTCFTTQLRPRDSIVLLPKGAGAAQVVQIVSDTELVIKTELKDLKALALLTSNEGCPYECVPHVDQEAVYQCVHEELHAGECITVFPEGGSHDRAELLPLKAGVTLMALGAMSKYPGLDVKIVPCGLNYFHAHRFRSRAVIEFGNPITISSNLVEQFKQGGSEKRRACEKLLETIHGALKSVTVNAGSYETLMLIQAARRLYKPAHRKLQISQVVDLNRRFLIGYNLFRDDPKVIDLQQRVLAYNQLLKYHGIKDHQVSKTDISQRRPLGLILRRLIILMILSLGAFPGVLLNLPAMIIANIISQKKANAALKASSVKIAGRDVLATWKVIVGAVVLPTLYAIYSLIVFFFIFKQDFDWRWKLALPVLTWVLLPFISYASLRVIELSHDILRSLQPSAMSFMNPDGAQTLRQNREKLSHDITALINEYGPKVFPDFDADYIRRTSQPLPSPPASRITSIASMTSMASSFSWSPSSSSLPRIASGFFQQAARMEWLEERNIFNWGRVDESDADDVFFFMNKQDGSISGRSRSGSISDSDSRPGSRGRSRANSIDGFKVEGMTSLRNRRNVQRPVFKIEDVDEEDHEEEGVDKLNIAEQK
ncbi:hypothetical protein EC973_002512 [Apophysomyces ossiformis]|uniref:Phospholipid/glycerol acyltransferase domain-containing protein n=1 Tax=Apophysomyces ossiformis TaxID=679940 RepID=A0A8H7BTU1_9FUNG|nr:hypothetical protein EC973_002512 [Apophysomyces ossiformis]